MSLRCGLFLQIVSKLIIGKVILFKYFNLLVTCLSCYIIERAIIKHLISLNGLYVLG